MKTIIISIITTLATLCIVGYMTPNNDDMDTFGSTHSGFNVVAGDKIGMGTTTPKYQLTIDPMTSDAFQIGSSTNQNIFIIDANGNVTAAGDIAASTNNSSTDTPRIFGYTDLTSGEAARFQFGDEHNALQNGYAQDTNLYAYWGLVLTGGRQNYNSGFVPMSFSKTLDTGVLVKSDTAGTGNDPGSSGNPITTLGIQATTTQWANLTEWMDSDGNTLSLVDYGGNFVIGDTATSTDHSLKVVGDTYLNGIMGIGTSTPQTTLQIVGLMSVYPDGTGTTTCSTLIEGAFMYSTGTQGFYGCDGSSWNQL